MNSRKSTDTILDGTVFKLNDELRVDRMNWYDHSKFGGVQLKDVIEKDATDGAISCHLVRIQPGCEIGLHVHDNSVELHQALEGEGRCHLGDREVVYRPGCMAVIPAATPHKVTAGAEGLLILASFAPPM